MSNLSYTQEQRQVVAALLHLFSKFDQTRQQLEQQHAEKQRAAQSELSATQANFKKFLSQVEDIRHKTLAYVHEVGLTGLLDPDLIHPNIKELHIISQQDIEIYLHNSENRLYKLKNPTLPGIHPDAYRFAFVFVLWIIFTFIIKIVVTFVSISLINNEVSLLLSFILSGILTLKINGLINIKSKSHSLTQSIMHDLANVEYWANSQLSTTAKNHQQRIEALQRDYEQQQQQLQQTFNQQLAGWWSDADAFIAHTRHVFPAWDAPDWNEWKPVSTATPIVQLGCFTPPNGQHHANHSTPISSSRKQVRSRHRTSGQHHANHSVPIYLDFPGTRSLLFKVTGDHKTPAVEAIQTLLLRLLASIPPGQVRFTFIDPVGLGQNVAAFMSLADHNEALVSGKAWSEPRHIEQQLANLTEHMENVIQKYLRNQYATIEDYNTQAGEIAEPYQVLVVFDFPVNFQDDAARRLVSIAQNGPRCGVFAIVLADLDKPRPYGFDLAALERVSTVVYKPADRNSFAIADEVYQHIHLELEKLPRPDLVNTILHQVGVASIEASKVEVPFDRIAPPPDEQWQQSAGNVLTVPMGPSGARKLQYFTLGSGTAHHALVVGQTGSGKSTLLHILITGIALHYSPTEMELYLLDFKKGVEFKTYATHQLPHARVIAIESEREFGLSVLEGLYREYERRGDQFRAVGVQNLKAYREQTGKPLPRILLLVDEFHKFFIEQDKLAHRAYQLLELLVREGRSAGIHVLLASQTLTGAASLSDSIKGSIGVRIALKCSEADSRLILADDNPAARLLSRPGEAIYNATNGLIEGNNSFQVAWLADDQRDQYLQEVRRRAHAQGYRKFQIVFEGNQPANIRKNHALKSVLVAPVPPQPPRNLLAWLGEPIAIKDLVTVTFKRQSSTNMLIVGTDELAALGMLTTTIISLAAQLPGAPVNGAQTFSILDFTTDAHEDYFRSLADAVPYAFAVSRRRQMPGMINVLAREVQRRIDADATGAPPMFFIIHGLHRARDLRQDAAGMGTMPSTSSSIGAGLDALDNEGTTDADGFGFANAFGAMFGDTHTATASAPANAAQQLPLILREGPEVGVYTIVWCDTMTNLNRVFDRYALREFVLRVAFQMSESDSHNLIDSPAANKLGAHRALLYNDEAGTQEKFRPYAVPDQQWLTEVTRILAQRGTK